MTGGARVLLVIAIVAGSVGCGKEGPPLPPEPRGPFPPEAVQVRQIGDRAEVAFTVDQDKSDLSSWLYNTTPEKPGDLGYWVGYRITRTYYQRASDKRQALRDILEMSDPKSFLAKSGWYPGIRLE